MYKKEKKRKVYTRLSESQKQEIIRGYHLEGKHPSLLAEEYGVPPPDTIRFNLRKFAAENDKSALLMKKGTKDEMAEAVRLLEKETSTTASARTAASTGIRPTRHTAWRAN